MQLFEEETETNEDIDDYNKEHCEILIGLRKILLQYNTYNDYDRLIAEADKRVEIAKKRYSRFKSEKRFEDLFQGELKRTFLKEEHENTDIVKLEVKLAEYEKYVDRKYWDVGLIEKMIIAININLCKSIEEAVELFGKEK